MGGFMYGALLLTGSLATAVAGGLVVVHWAAGVRPHLDGDGWLIATYGLVALAACSIIDGDPSGYTVTLVVLAVAAAFVAGLRRCGSVVVLVPVDEDSDGDGR